eukprot:COSAG06_NODE_1109_length_10653_cov_103.721148_1_plen_92_part_00
MSLAHSASRNSCGSCFARFVFIADCVFCLNSGAGPNGGDSLTSTLGALSIYFRSTLGACFALLNDRHVPRASQTTSEEDALLRQARDEANF